MTLGIVEEADRQPLDRRLGAHHATASQLLDLIERGAHVRDLDVEGNVAVVALRPGADAAADSHPLGVRVALAGDDVVLGRTAGRRGVEAPSRELGIKAPQLADVVSDDLEVHYWLTHFRFLSAPAGGAIARNSYGPGTSLGLIGISLPRQRRAGEEEEPDLEDDHRGDDGEDDNLLDRADAVLAAGVGFALAAHAAKPG